MGGDAEPQGGFVAPELRDEFPGLGLRYLVIEHGSGRAPRQVTKRLAELMGDER